MTYSLILRSVHLLRQPHEQHIRPLVNPVIVESLFSLGSDGVVGALQRLQDLVQGAVDLCRKNRHVHKRRAPDISKCYVCGEVRRFQAATMRCESC